MLLLYEAMKGKTYLCSEQIRKLSKVLIDTD